MDSRLVKARLVDAAEQTAIALEAMDPRLKALDDRMDRIHRILGSWALDGPKIDARLDAIEAGLAALVKSLAANPPPHLAPDTRPKRG